MMWRIDKSSLNMFAEGLLKTMGAYDPSGKPSRWGDMSGAATAVSGFLDRLGIKPEQYVIEDGSGLSHGNRVTPPKSSPLLKFVNPARAGRNGGRIWPSPAAKGTLRSRMKEFKGEDKVHAKTGSIGGVSSLSGYVKAEPGPNLRLQHPLQRHGQEQEHVPPRTPGRHLQTSRPSLSIQCIPSFSGAA